MKGVLFLHKMVEMILAGVAAAKSINPATLNYEGFPKSVCTSINDEVCHGIPSSDIL